MLTVIFAVSLLGAAAPEPAAPLTLGDCVWSHVSDTDKADIGAAYRKAKLAGLESHVHDVDPVVEAKMPALEAAFAQCDRAPGIPAKLIEAAVVVESERFGAAELLADSRHITRAELQAAWAAAPQDVRSCTLADVEDYYGVTAFSCADHVAANRWFLARFGIEPGPPNEDDASMVIYYEHEEAEGALAAHLILTAKP